MLRGPDGIPTTGAASTIPSVTTPDKALCTICRERPRLGELTRCKQCLQKAADADRRARAKVEATVNARAKTRKPAEVKRCSACTIAKPLDAFSPHHRSKDGKRKACRSCVRAGRALCKPLRPEQVAV